MMRAATEQVFAVDERRNSIHWPVHGRVAKTPTERVEDAEEGDFHLVYTAAPAGAEQASVIDLTGASGEECDDDDQELVLEGIDEEFKVGKQREQRVKTTSGHEGRLTEWLVGVARIFSTENPDNIVFPDIRATDWCACKGKYYRDRCPNAVTGRCCSSWNCQVDTNCGNRLEDTEGLQLRMTKNGISVYTKIFVSAGTIAGEYAGALMTHGYHKDTKRIHDYALALEHRTTLGHRAYIDACDRGGITRFINHSCDPDYLFFGVQNRRRRRITVVAIRDILPDSEVTQNHGDIWFHCMCGSQFCRQGQEFGSD